MTTSWRKRSWSKWFMIRSGVVLLAAIVAGCASEPTNLPVPQVVETAPPPPEPTLAVAGDASLTLFGEFPNRPRVPFQARAASPMKQHSFTTEGEDFDVDLSPDGKWLVFSSTRHSAKPDLYLKGIDGIAVTQVTSDPAADVQPTFSPDGKSIIFASNRAGNWDLWLIGVEGGQATQITRSPQHEVHPTFAPDGKRLAYCMFNDKADQWELWTLQLDLPGSKKMIGLGLFPDWSPVTDSIVYQKARQRGSRWFSIWRVDLVLGEPKFPVELVSSAEMAFIQPNWSPDGGWITFGSAQIGSTGEELPASKGAMLTHGDIWIVQADGSTPLRLTDGAGAHFGSVWGPQGRVYFTSLQNGSENIWSIKPLLAPMTQVPSAADDNAAGISSAGMTAGPAGPGQGG